MGSHLCRLSSLLNIVPRLPRLRIFLWSVYSNSEFFTVLVFVFQIGSMLLPRLASDGDAPAATSEQLRLQESGSPWCLVNHYLLTFSLMVFLFCFT
jgi:hypothetical protein